jgi:DUF917 family protein
MLSKSNLQDLVRGAAFLGSGGGGNLAAGASLLATLGDDASAYPGLVSSSDLAPDSWGCLIADMGTVGAFSKHQAQAACDAFVRLQRDFLGPQRKFSVVAPIEIGSENTLIPFAVAQQFRIPVLDSDTCGRAIPELNMSPLASGNHPESALSNGDGVTMSCSVPDAATLERVLRPLMSLSTFGNSASLAFWPFQLSQVPNFFVEGSLGTLIRIGQLLGSLPSSKSIVDTLASCGLKARLGFSGQLVDVLFASRRGFDRATASFLAKTGESGTAYFQNEALLFETGDDHLAVCTAPHSICFLEQGKGPRTLAELPDCKGSHFLIYFVQAHPHLLVQQLVQPFRKALDRLKYRGPFRY